MSQSIGMKIEEIKILRGPNIWSTYRRELISMKLDLGELEDYPTNKIEGFAERLEQLIPTLYEHECSEDRPGGFFERVKQGTWMGHVVEHIALELQTLGGMCCGYGRTRSAGRKGVYHVVFSYEIPSAGVFAANAAVRIVEALIKNEPYNINNDITELKRIKESEGPDPRIQVLIDEARNRKIPVRCPDRHTVILGQGINQRIVQSNMSFDTDAGLNGYFPGKKLIDHISHNGTHANIPTSVLEMLYPGNTASRIPLVAVTGTNGKTTTARLIAHIAGFDGYTAGFACTDGVYLGDKVIGRGDCSGPSSAELLLQQPELEFAVLECARGGILRSGLGFDKCNVSIITNITNDHLGLNDVNTIKEMAKVKSVVAHATFDEGYAILNADDDLVYRIKNQLDCNVALFSTDFNNARIRNHIDQGRPAAYIKDGNFILHIKDTVTKLAAVKQVPLTLEGKASCMIKNILPAILAARLSGITIEAIRKGLNSFVPGPKFTPGRMNVFKFNNFELMVDYAHNGDGFEELAKFLKSTKSDWKVGIVTSPGDRRASDIQDIGYRAAQMFDEIIIRHDKDGRGRSNEQLTKLIMQGIRQYNSNMPVKIVSHELEAIQYAIENVKDGSFIVTCTEDVKAAIELVSGLQEKIGMREKMSNE